MNEGVFLVGVAVGFCLAVMLYAVLRFFAPWARALCSGAHVRFLYIIGMRLRGSPPGFLIDAYCSLVQSGHRTSMKEIESYYIAHKHTIRRDDVHGFIELVKKRIAENAKIGEEGTGRRT